MAELDQEPPPPRLQQEIRPQNPPQRSRLSSLSHSTPSHTTHDHRGVVLSTVYYTTLHGGDWLPEIRGDGEEHFCHRKSVHGHGG